MAEPKPSTPVQESKQRDALMQSEKHAAEPMPGSFKDEAVTDKVVVVPDRPKDQAPIKGLDPKSP